MAPLKENITKNCHNGYAGLNHSTFDNKQCQFRTLFDRQTDRQTDSSIWIQEMPADLKRSGQTESRQGVVVNMNQLHELT